jgi:hypothetical protein
MKKKTIKTILLAGLCLLFVGCTENQRTRNFGGTSNETLPAGQKLLVATWKQDDLWMLTRPMQVNEKPEVYEFRESSSFGLLQGKVVISETR